jgi:hypothetical protein
VGSRERWQQLLPWLNAAGLCSSSSSSSKQQLLLALSLQQQQQQEQEKAAHSNRQMGPPMHRPHLQQQCTPAMAPPAA